MSETSVTQSPTGDIVPAPRLYKVLVDGQSAHGGSMTWSLPTKTDNGKWQAGDWHEIAGPLELCSVGLHLTTQPIDWYMPDASIYLAEYDGDLEGDLTHDTKVCVRRCRLLAEVEWSEYQVYRSGEHALTGNATATLYGNATARLTDNATATLYGNATARLYGNATATLYGNATAISDPWHSPSAEVELANLAAHVDRRNGKLILRRAEVTP